MARHHVISSTACDVFFKLVAHQKKSLGARFDSMIVTFSADGQPVLGAALRNATSGCELHRLAGQPDECWCCGYDEQLEFVSQANVPLAHADYRLTLSNGETWTGTTDAKGRTGRVASKREEQITQAEFLPHADKSPCCASAPKHLTPAVKVVRLDGITTTDKDVGSSVRQVKVKDKVRPLTRGEIDMAWLLFQDAIDYGKVKVHGEPYLWFGLQPKDVAMTSDSARIAMSYRHTLLFLLATLTAIDASAWSRMGPAAVITEAGLPCFQIANEEQRSRGPVSLKMMTISTPGPNGWKNVWTVMFPNASFGDPTYRLPERGCVRYGKAPEGAESSDAAPLVAGKVYGVSFLGRPPSASDPTSRYSADFCLLMAPSGGFHVVQLTNGKNTCAPEEQSR